MDRREPLFAERRGGERWAVAVRIRDDPYASFARAAALARAWGSELHDAGDAGHINTDAGYGPWPQGLMLWRDWLEGLPLPA